MLKTSLSSNSGNNKYYFIFDRHWYTRQLAIVGILGNILYEVFLKTFYGIQKQTNFNFMNYYLNFKLSV